MPRACLNGGARGTGKANVADLGAERSGLSEVRVGQMRAGQVRADQVRAGEVRRF